MADNPPQPSIFWSVLFRSALVFIATCITICVAIAAVPVLFVMFILVAVSPESFSNLRIGGDTVHIRMDLNVTHGPQRAPYQRARAHRSSPHPTNPQDNQPSSPQSPPSPAYNWSRQYSSRQPAPLDTTFAVQQPYTWRSTSRYVPSHPNIYNTMPPYLPPISEPEPRPLFSSQYGAYTSMDPSPPFRASPIPPPPTNRLVRTNPNISWTADDRLPPARPDDAMTPTRPGPRRRSTAESMPGQIPIVDDESDDEILPVYDRPPEYDDERHSQHSPR